MNAKPITVESDPSSPVKGRHKPLLFVAIFIPLLLAFAVNVNILQNGFVWDDIPLLTDWGRQANAKGDPSIRPYYRPVASWSSRIDRNLWDQNPMGYHLTGLILHGGATALVTLIGLGLFREDPRRIPVSMLAGSLFAVHPAHSEAVAWISARNELLLTFFLLIAVFAHLWNRRGSRTWWTFPLFISGITLALFSKETAAPFLLIFPIYDFFLWRTHHSGWRKLLTPSTGILVLLGLGYTATRAQMIGNLIGSISIQEGGWLNHAGTILWATGFYVKHLFFPYPLNVFMTVPPMPSFPYLAYMGIGLLTFLLTAYWTINGKAPRFTVGLWAVLLGLTAALAIALTEIVQTPVAERYLYLPSVGFVYLAAGGLFSLSDKLSSRFFSGPNRFVPILMVSVVLVAFCVATYHRNQIWKDEITLWEDASEKSPGAALPHDRLGRAYAKAGRLQDARHELLQALQGEGNVGVLASSAINLGAVYYEEGRLDLSEQAYRKAFEFQDRAQLHFGLGIIYWDRARQAISQQDTSAPALLSQSREYLIQAIIRDDTHIQAFHALSLVNLAQDNPSAARSNLKKVIELNPNSPLAQDAAQRLSRLKR